MVASTTKFKLNSPFLYIPFFRATYLAAKHARRSRGLIAIKINPITLRTLTVWRSLEELREFRNTGSHLEAMRRSKYFGSTVSVTWETDAIPAWDEAIKRLNEDGGEAALCW